LLRGEIGARLIRLNEMPNKRRSYRLSSPKRSRLAARHAGDDADDDAR